MSATRRAPRISDGARRDSFRARPRDRGGPDAIAGAQRIAAFLEEYESFVPDEYRVSFWFQLASIFFACSEHGEALVFVNELLNSGFDKVRPDLQIHGRPLNLMIHSELKNFIPLGYFAANTEPLSTKTPNYLDLPTWIAHNVAAH